MHFHFFAQRAVAVFVRPGCDCGVDGLSEEKKPTSSTAKTNKKSATCIACLTPNKTQYSLGGRERAKCRVLELDNMKTMVEVVARRWLLSGWPSRSRRSLPL